MNKLYRGRYLKFRASPSEELVIRRLAERQGVNLSECVRLAILTAAERAGLPAVGAVSAYDDVPAPKPDRRK